MAAPNTESLSLDTLEIVAGSHYEKNGYPHARMDLPAQECAGLLV